LFADGSATRGRVAAGGSNPSGTTYIIPLAEISSVVQFEVGMTLRNYTYAAGTISVISATTASVTAVDRSAGIITVLASGADATWISAGKALAIDGDIVAGAVSTGSAVALSGLAAWLPASAPSPSDSFWGVNRSTDATRLAGLRYDASAQTIEEGITNALAFMNREGARPDIAIMDFASYAALVNSLGAKVQYVQMKHDEVEVAFDGIRFQSAYGVVNVLADRSCPPRSCYLLDMKTWKLRTLGKAPQILTYGMEGLEGLRVGNADALEIRIGYYGNLICSAPGRNCIVTLSA
jgi:hypothetical protein